MSILFRISSEIKEHPQNKGIELVPIKQSEKYTNVVWQFFSEIRLESGEIKDNIVVCNRCYLTCKQNMILKAKILEVVIFKKNILKVREKTWYLNRKFYLSTKTVSISQSNQVKLNSHILECILD